MATIRLASSDLRVLTWVTSVSLGWSVSSKHTPGKQESRFTDRGILLLIYRRVSASSESTSSRTTDHQECAYQRLYLDSVFLFRTSQSLAALLTWPLFARHIDLASASPLLPQTFPCWSPLRALARSFGISPRQVGGQAVLGRQSLVSTPWLTERHGYDPTLLFLPGLSSPAISI